MQIVGFEWDAGNWPKCAKHGASREEIEDVLSGSPFVRADAAGTTESRFDAVGQTEAGRFMFIVFTIKAGAEGLLIRPISARFMHDKEVRRYDQTRGA